MLKHGIIGSTDGSGSEPGNTREIDVMFRRKLSDIYLAMRKWLVREICFGEEEVMRSWLSDEERKDVAKVIEHCEAVGEERNQDLSTA